jgi:hypothetical protein
MKPSFATARFLDGTDTRPRLTTAFLHKSIALFGYSGCFIIGPATIVMVVVFHYATQSGSDRLYCPHALDAMCTNTTRFLAYGRYQCPDLLPGGGSWIENTKKHSQNDSIAGWYEYIPEISEATARLYDKAPPTISAATEGMPHICVFILGTGVCNICIATIFVTMLYMNKHDSKGNLCGVPKDALVPSGAYICMILMWGVVGTSMRGSDAGVIILHNVVAMMMFGTSYATVWIFFLQRPQNSRVACLTLLACCGASIGLIVYGSVVGAAVDIATIERLEGEWLLSIGELTYVGFFSILMGLLFHNALTFKVV